MSGPATLEQAERDVAGAILRSDRFRLQREDDWRRLDAILTKMEKRRLRKVSDADLLDLPALYRTAASSLAVARETTLDAETIRYLESLVRRAWFQIYGPNTGLGRWLARFLGGGWSRAVRAMWLDLCIALAVMIVGTLAGWALCARDPEWYYRIVPAGLAGERGPDAGREALAATLFTRQESGLAGFAAQLFSNNAGVAIFAFALGFAFGVPTLLLLLYNTAALGAMLWLFSTNGLGPDFAAWLSVHGTTELGAILLAGAAGLHVGRAMALPGTRPVLAATRAAGQRGAVVMLGVVLMLVLAALLEGFVRQLLTDSFGRALIGTTLALAWIAYFWLVGRHDRAERAA